MKTRILLVDDEPELLELLEEILESEGFETCKAQTAGEFYAQALAKQPNLIILDIDLAGINGPEVYHMLLQKGLDNRIPVIFLSGLVPQELQTHAGAGRHYAMVSKPFDQEQLIEDIRRMIDKASASAA